MAWVSHPASAMYPRASAAWDAENVVLLPSSRAFDSRAARSSPVAPDSADTLDMDDSKAEPISTTAEAASLMPPTAAVTAVEARLASVPLRTV